MKRVLVCEDEDSIREFVVINLVRSGYEVVDVNCGEDALKAYDEKDGGFDVALLDIMMPEMDGYEVLQHLKSNPETNNIPVIIMSALSDMQSIVKGYQLGATEYVTKPFQREELVKRVAHRYEPVSYTHLTLPTKLEV